MSKAEQINDCMAQTNLGILTHHLQGLRVAASRVVYNI